MRSVENWKTVRAESNRIARASAAGARAKSKTHLRIAAPKVAKSRERRGRSQIRAGAAPSPDLWNRIASSDDRRRADFPVRDVPRRSKTLAISLRTREFEPRASAGSPRRAESPAG